MVVPNCRWHSAPYVAHDPRWPEKARAVVGAEECATRITAGRGPWLECTSHGSTDAAKPRIRGVMRLADTHPEPGFPILPVRSRIDATLPCAAVPLQSAGREDWTSRLGFL